MSANEASDEASTIDRERSETGDVRHDPPDATASVRPARRDYPKRAPHTPDPSIRVLPDGARAE